MKSFVRAGALVAAVALAAAGCSSSSTPDTGTGTGTGASQRESSSVAAPTGTPYVIGAPSQLSGPNKTTYAGLPSTLEAWEKSVNAAGGINGHPVKVLVKDTAGNAAQGLAVTKSLVEEDNAIAIVGSDPAIEQAVLPYLVEKKIPSLTAHPLYPFWTSTPGFYALGIPYSPEAFTAMLKIAQTAKVHSMASVVCAEVAACAAPGAILSGGAGSYDIKYGGTLTVSAAAASYTPQCLQLKGQGAEAVVMSVSLAVSQKVVADCSAQGFNPTYYFAFQSFSPALASIPGIKAFGLSPVQLWYSTGPSMTQFHAALKQYGDESKADMPSMFVWTALETFKAGAVKAGGEPTAAAVTSGINSLTDFDANGLMAGKTSFSSGPSPKITCYFVGKLSDGKLSQEGNTAQCLE